MSVKCHGDYRSQAQKERCLENETIGRDSTDKNSPAPSNREENYSTKLWRCEENEVVNEEKSIVTEEISLPWIKMDDRSLLASVIASEFIAEQKKCEI